MTWCLLVVVAMFFDVLMVLVVSQDFLSTGDYVSVNWNKSSIRNHGLSGILRNSFKNKVRLRSGSQTKKSGENVRSTTETNHAQGAPSTSASLPVQQRIPPGICCIIHSKQLSPPFHSLSHDQASHDGSNNPGEYIHTATATTTTESTTTTG